MADESGKVTVRRDQLADVYQLAAEIAHLSTLEAVSLPEGTNKYAYVLGVAQSKAELIQALIEVAIKGKVRGDNNEVNN